jgi:hypothetical protein
VKETKQTQNGSTKLGIDPFQVMFRVGCFKLLFCGMTLALGVFEYICSTHEIRE